MERDLRLCRRDTPDGLEVRMAARSVAVVVAVVLPEWCMAVVLPGWCMA